MGNCLSLIVDAKTDADRIPCMKIKHVPPYHSASVPSRTAVGNASVKLRPRDNCVFVSMHHCVTLMLPTPDRRLSLLQLAFLVLGTDMPHLLLSLHPANAISPEC